VAFTRGMLPYWKVGSVDMVDTCTVGIHEEELIAEACHHKGTEAGSYRVKVLRAKGGASDCHSESLSRPWGH